MAKQETYRAITRTWYEVTDGNMSNSFNDLKEAKAELENMRNGYPDKMEMSEENQKYWKEHGKLCFVVKVSQSKKLVAR